MFLRRVANEHDQISEQVWQAHLEWLHRHAHQLVEQERWTAREWQLARLLADQAWTRTRCGLYLYQAEHALRQVQYRRAQQQLARNGDLSGLVELLRRSAA